MEQAFLLLKNQNERWDEIIREYNERKFDELMAGFHQRYSPNRSLRLTSAQNTSKYHPSKNLHLARKLIDPLGENTSFRDHNLLMNRGEELPLETIMSREPLGGRFVFPPHASALAPTEERQTIDVPKTKINAALNLYGFEGTPERYGKNQDPEGIIYGDLEPDSVRRLNKKPFIIGDLQRAASMFLPSDIAPSKVGDEGAERYRTRELAQMIMDAEIPGALIDPQTARAAGVQSFQDITNTDLLNDLTGNIPMPTQRANAPLHGAFQLWERPYGISGRVGELDETHTSPEQMQLLDDQLTAIPGALKDPTQFYRSEPMDIAFQLLKEARPHAFIDNFDLDMLLNPKSSARPKLLRRYFPHATSEDEIPMDELATEQEIRQRDTDYFPLTQTQIEYREKEAPPIFANVATDKVSYDPFWQDVMTGEPMDLAMRLLKEFYIGDDEEGMQGFYTPADISNEALLSIPRNQTMNRMSGVDKNTVQEIQNKGDYTTGGSQPRLQSNGDFIGADVRGINDSDESIQGLANILGHEYTHSLINPEINEWAEQQHGPLQSQVKPEYPTDMQGASFLQRLKTKPTNQAEMDAEKQRVALANQARVYAHEYGAHQSDQSNQTGVNEMLQQRPDTYEYWNHLQSQQPQMIQQGEPMEIAMQLLKERVSPEAKRHKLEYDKKYESSPERVKYREELNRERRRRHIMGQGGPDMSHTSQHTIVPEDPHTNRARHFKDKGTLL